MLQSEKIKISWDQFYLDTLELCNIIKNNNHNIKGIVCVTRGGLVASSIVASQLNIKKIEVYGISTYKDDNTQDSKINILTEPKEALLEQGENWLVIDDLVDTANTIEFIRSKLPKSYIYTTYSKQENCYNIQGYYKYYNKNIWLELPWELD